MSNVDLIRMSATSYAPPDGRKYYYYDLKAQRVTSTIMKSTHMDTMNFILGNVHEYPRSAEAWGEETEARLDALLDQRKSRSLLDQLEMRFELSTAAKLVGHHAKLAGRKVKEAVLRTYPQLKRKKS